MSKEEGKATTAATTTTKKKGGTMKMNRSGESLLMDWSRAVMNEANEQLQHGPQPAMKVVDLERCAVVLALRVEARLRMVLEEAKLRTWGRHGEEMSAEDINLALEASGEQRLLLGQPSREARRVGAGNKRSLVASREIDLKKRLNTLKRAQSSAPPTEPTVSLDWLAIQGKARHTQQDQDFFETEEDNINAERKLPGVTREHELYVRKVIATIRDDATDDIERRQILRSLRRDHGICVVAPALVAFCCAEATAAKKRSISSLRLAVATMKALAMNPSAKIEPVLHELLPAALTCVVAKRLGPKKAYDLDLRLDAARCVAEVALEYGDKYPTLRPRIAKTYADALHTPDKPLAVKYGAIAGVHALGPIAVSSILVPNIISLAADIAEQQQQQNASTPNALSTISHACFHALAFALACGHLRPLVLSYTPKSIDSLSSPNDLHRTKKRRFASEDKHSNGTTAPATTDLNQLQELGRCYRRRPISSDILNISDTFGELFVPLVASPYAASVFL